MQPCILVNKDFHCAKCAVYDEDFIFSVCIHLFHSALYNSFVRTVRHRIPLFHFSSYLILLRTVQDV